MSFPAEKADLRYWAASFMLALPHTACAPGEVPPAPDSPSGLAPVHSTYIAEDGVRIEYDQRGAGKTVLVFVHGWSCDRGYWRNQVDHFAARYEVLAVDLAGHGASGGVDRTAWSMATFAGDIEGIIEQEDLQNVVLVGHSMGGPIAVEVASHLPERVIGVVVVDGLHDVSVTLSDEQIDGILAPFRQDFEGTVNQFARARMFPSGADSALVSLIATDMAAAPPAVALASFEAFLEWDARAVLDNVDDPIHLINADMMPVNEEAFDDDGPRPTVTYLEGASHFLMLGRPDHFNSELQTTLDLIAVDGGR